MTNRAIRVRFAPSPTGPLHIGGVRTALYNWLFAKKNGGTFILRIEDTDQTRLVSGAENYIMEALEWCGIDVDEGVREGGEYGPYRQSDRRDIYRNYALKLVERGFAYYAFDTPESLEQLRSARESEGASFFYNAAVRGSLDNSLIMSHEEVRKRIDGGEPFVIRFKTPESRQLEFSDIVRGDITVDCSTLDDKVLFKSDGMPTYHLANIVDDHLMKISHVIRGEEWLPSLPLHVLLYEAFGWEKPLFAHLPLILKPSGKGKLSKRDGDKMGFPVFPLYWPYGDTATGYREEGYFPEAFVNMLALLGWNPGTEEELFSAEDLIENFSLERVGKSGARFDPEKAVWFNRQYLMKKADSELAEPFAEELKGKGFEVPAEKVLELVRMVKERVSFVSELWGETDFFFVPPQDYDQKVVKKRWKEDSGTMMRELAELIDSADDVTSAGLESRVKGWISDRGHNMGAVLNLARLFLTGAARGPHLFDIMAWLGREETVSRIIKGVDCLS